MKALFVLMALLVTSPAFAHIEYPRRVRIELDLASTPDCILCHTTRVGRKGTADQEFAQTLRALGLPTTLAETTLAGILHEMDTCAIDTDGDEVPDVEEIRNRGNPSDGPGPVTTECGAAAGGAGGGTGRVELASLPGDEVFTGRLPEHGCALVRGSSPALGVGWALALGILARSLRVSIRRRGRVKP